MVPDGCILTVSDNFILVVVGRNWSPGNDWTNWKMDMLVSVISDCHSVSSGGIQHYSNPSFQFWSSFGWNSTLVMSLISAQQPVISGVYIIYAISAKQLAPV